MDENVTPLAEYVRRGDMEAALSTERQERRKEVRRECDRVRAELLQLREVVVGKRGDNGLSSRVLVLEGSVGRVERVGWVLFGLMMSGLTGVAVKAFGG